MKNYKIKNKSSGLTMGVYKADTKEAALDALAQDAGYRDHADAVAQFGGEKDLIVEEVSEGGGCIQNNFDGNRHEGGLMKKEALKTVDMGTPSRIERKGMAVRIDGEMIDSWDSVAKTARAGWQVWTLTDEQVAQMTTDEGMRLLDRRDPMRNFHK